MKAPIWRYLMKIGMKFHHFAGKPSLPLLPEQHIFGTYNSQAITNQPPNATITEPKPPRPDFKIVIPSRISPRGGTFKLVFYVPQAYVDEQDHEGYRFPVVVNFHGGGFTLGTGTDDARWAASVVNKVDAVFVSVEYRLAPEYPFSVGVEDGTDALIYLASHADELRLDPNRIALSGFSAGGNFAFTVPLMLYDLQHQAGKRSIADTPNKNLRRPVSSRNHAPSPYRSSSTLSLPQASMQRSQSANSSTLKLTDLEPTALEREQRIPDLTILCIVSFYPPTDFRTTREAKRATNPHPEKNLPPLLTDLFDASYLRPDSDVDLTDPYLSPAAATDDFLKEAYPQDIVLYTCEYDMLNVEGVEFGERLSSHPINKRLHGGLIKGAPHAFDKKPNPLSFPTAADKCYAEACAELRRVFGGRTSVEEIRQLEDEYPVERFEAEVEGDTVIGEGDDDDPNNKKRERRLSSLSRFRSKWGTKPSDTAPVNGEIEDAAHEARGRPELKKELTEIEEEMRGRPSMSPSLSPPAATETRKREKKVDRGFAFGRGASPS
jgi:acetyl esterase/lipase